MDVPERIDNCTLLLADVVVIPSPGFGVDRLSDTTEHPQRAKIVALEMVLTQPAKEPDRGGRSIELGDLVALDNVPVTRGCRVDGRALEYGRGDAVEERAVDDVSVPGDPADIGHACELVFGVDVEYVFDGECCAEEVAASGLFIH